MESPYGRQIGEGRNRRGTAFRSQRLGGGDLVHRDDDAQAAARIADRVQVACHDGTPALRHRGAAGLGDDRSRHRAAQPGEARSRHGEREDRHDQQPAEPATEATPLHGLQPDGYSTARQDDLVTSNRVLARIRARFALPQGPSCRDCAARAALDGTDGVAGREEVAEWPFSRRPGRCKTGRVYQPV